MHHVLFGYVIAAQRHHRLALVHHHHAVAQAQQLDRVRGDQQNRRPSRGQLAHEAMNLLLGADIDSARRFRQQQDLRLLWQPFGDRDFLLISAAQAQHPLFGGTHLDLQLGDQRIDQRPLAAPVDQAEPADCIQIGQRQVVAHRELQDEPFGLAVFWHKGVAPGHGRARSAHRRGLAIEQDLALDPMQPEKRGQQLALPLALQPAEAQDLAPMQIEIDVLEAVPGAEIANREHHRSGYQFLDRWLRWEDIGDLAPDHELDQLVGRGARSGHRGDVLAVLEHRDPVGDREDLFQPVGNEDHGHTPVAQLAQRGEEELNLALVEGGGGFVQNEELRLGDDRLGELDKLPLGERKLSCLGLWIDLDSEIVEDSGCLCFDARVIDLPEPCGRHAPKEDVLRHGQVRAETQFLVDGADADRFGLVRRQALIRDAVERDRAGIGLMHSRHQVDPGALAGAVLTHQRVNFARVDIEAHPIEHDIARERLGQVGGAQNGRGIERRHWCPRGTFGGLGSHESLSKQ